MLDTSQWNEVAVTSFQSVQGQRMPLVRTGSMCEPGKALLRFSPRELFPGSREPDAVLAGLLLYLNCWDDAHNIAQDIPTGDGSYWHAIIHRMEPDPANSGYWFRRVGRHAIFPDLQSRAQTIARQYPQCGFTTKDAWDAFHFIEYCGQANACRGSECEAAAVEMQQAEWELLMQWCHG